MPAMLFSRLASVCVAFVALLHLLFFVLESFLWTKPTGQRVFGLTRELAESTKSLAANQGLYNAFLAAGLIWGLIPGPHAFAVKVFFLSCVVIAGIVGGFTAKRSILVIQALPGAVALLLVLFTQR
jgi:putative membrane protein